MKEPMLKQFWICVLGAATQRAVHDGYAPVAKPFVSTINATKTIAACADNTWAVGSFALQNTGRTLLKTLRELAQVIWVKRTELVGATQAKAPTRGRTSAPHGVGWQSSPSAAVMMGVLATCALAPSALLAGSSLQEGLTNIAPVLAPANPEGWAWEQAFIKQRRQDFLKHIKGGRNYTVPISPAEFSWKIDWKAQQKYCKNIAKALFEDRRKLSFPEPQFTAFRDPFERYAEIQKNSYPNCAGMHDDDSKEYEGMHERYQKQKFENEKPLSTIHHDRFYSRGSFLAQETLIQNKASNEKPTLYSARLVMSNRRGCPSEISFEDEGYFSAAAGRDENAKTILFEIDGEYTLSEFGVYRQFNDKFVESPPHRWTNTTRWGAPGRGFVVATGVAQSLLGSFAITRPSDEEADRIVTKLIRTEITSEPLYTCVINFDLSSKSSPNTATVIKRN